MYLDSKERRMKPEDLRFFDDNTDDITSIILETLYDCPRKLLDDGQLVKDMPYSVYCKVYHSYMKNKIVYKDQARSSNLCRILEYFYKKYLNINKTYKFLDVGCADGVPVAFMDNYPNIIASGCDIDENWVAYCISKNIDCFLADINDINTFKHKKYDIVFASKVLNLTKNFKESLMNMINLTKKNGYVILLSGFAGVIGSENHYCAIETPSIIIEWSKLFDMKVDLIEYITHVDHELSTLISNDEGLFIFKKK
jgi:SAM-dependent methyltransferase